MPVGPAEWFSLKVPAGFTQIQNGRSREEEINKTFFFFFSESRWLCQGTDLNHEDSSLISPLADQKNIVMKWGWLRTLNTAPQVAFISKFLLFC